MVTVNGVTALVLPATSVEVSLKVLAPVGSAAVGVTLQLPSAATTAVLTSPPGKVTVMVSPGVPVPLRVGVLSALMLSPTVALSLSKASATAGAAGAGAAVMWEEAVMQRLLDWQDVSDLVGPRIHWQLAPQKSARHRAVRLQSRPAPA